MMWHVKAAYGAPGDEAQLDFDIVSSDPITVATEAVSRVDRAARAGGAVPMMLRYVKIKVTLSEDAS